MNLQKLIFTENDCYKAGKTIVPQGIMVHSTGANNPALKRYVGPDDGKLGVNKYGNHWNVPGLSVCVHAFIGKLADGSVATYQTLPWDRRGWHCYKGENGSGNNTHISFEICEDGLEDGVYFGKVYREAVELCAFLCKEYGLPVESIICHSEGHDLGIASDHSDVMHWFPKHGKSMDTFRADVAALLAAETEEICSREKFLTELQEALGATVSGMPDLETLGRTVTIGAKYNRSHPCVKPVQKRLFALGYKEVGKADGVAGAMFTSALLHFQMDAGCTMTGMAEEWGRTWQELIWRE